MVFHVPLANTVVVVVVEVEGSNTNVASGRDGVEANSPAGSVVNTPLEAAMVAGEVSGCNVVTVAAQLYHTNVLAGTAAGLVKRVVAVEGMG